MQPRSILIGLVATGLFVACVDNPSETTLRQQLTEYGGDDSEGETLPPPPPPSGHQYPQPPPGHDPDGPYYPAPLYPCLSCHRPASQPPLPAQCTRCHKITDPTDPHNGIYPPGQGPDFEPGGTPVPDFCLDCHRIKPMPMPVETWSTWTAL
jgi:hypothetical protein